MSSALYASSPRGFARCGVVSGVTGVRGLQMLGASSRARQSFGSGPSRVLMGEGATCTLIAIARAAMPALAGFAAPEVSRVWGRLVRRAVGYSGLLRRESRSGGRIGRGAVPRGEPSAPERRTQEGPCSDVSEEVAVLEEDADKRGTRGARPGARLALREARTAGAATPRGGERSESGRGSHRVVSRETAIREPVRARLLGQPRCERVEVNRRIGPGQWRLSCPGRDRGLLHGNGWPKSFTP